MIGGFSDDSNQMGHGENMLPLDTGNIEWIDSRIRKERRHRYRDLKRDHSLEEAALEETIQCRVFKARLRPQVCMLRKKMYPYKPCVECTLPDGA